MLIQLIMLSCLIMGFNGKPIESEWQLRKNASGIAVYSRNLDENSIDEIKVVTTVQGSLSATINVIMNADKYEEWVYGCIDSRVLKRINEYEQFQYQISDLPYPFLDRDIIIHLKACLDAETNVVYTSSTSEPLYLAETPGKVRIQVYNASYTLTPADSGLVDLVYLLKFDPGGTLPLWLANKFIITAPFETMMKFRERVERETLNERKLNFINDPQGESLAEDGK